MPVVIINWMAVVVAALVAMAIGAIWYSPPIFGKRWMGLLHKNQKSLSKGGVQAYVAVGIILLIESYVLAHIVSYSGAVSAFEGAQTGFWVWLGFAAAASLLTYVIERRSKKLWLLDATYQLIVLVVMGAIIAAWGF